MIDLTADSKGQVEQAKRLWEEADRVHKPFRDKASHFYALYRNYQAFRDEWRRANPPDRDELMREGERTWGAGLFIPHGYAAVETFIPRTFSHRPRPLILPGDMEKAPRNVENMRHLVDRQLGDIDYEVQGQKTVKNSAIYGLGIQKTTWETRQVTRKRLAPSVVPEPGHEFVEEEFTSTVFDGPTVDDVDPFQFRWDPMADDLKDCGYVIHQAFRSTRYVRAKLQSGDWSGVPSSRLGESGGKQAFEEVWAERHEAAGYGQRDFARRDTQEIWEIHAGRHVVTVLNRAFVVKVAENYWHGEFPFQVCRPSIIGGQFAGIGLIEPIEHLIREMNTLRSQRRDNATLVLSPTFLYADGMIDRDDLEFGPANAIGVDGGDPREVIHKIDVGDIPYSSVRESEEMLRDIERTTGLSDREAGAAGGDTTATEAQLMHAAANFRIQNATRLMEVELFKPTARQFGLLNQQMIVTPKPVLVEETPKPGQTTPKYKLVKMGPAELAGDFIYEYDGGATAPENVPQMRADFNLAMQLRGDPDVDQRQLKLFALEKLGVKRPEAWIQSGPSLEAVLNVLAASQEEGGGGLPEEFLAQAVQMAQRLEAQQQQGPQQNGNQPVEA